MINKINIRVYALCVKDRKVLALHEGYAGEKLIKFPGGGLEYGEGTIECLKREFAEELNLKITNINHFYTQEDFIISRFKENEQLMTIYYTADIENEDELKILDEGIEKLEWLPLDQHCPFQLPVDIIVFERLKAAFVSGKY